jgi:hypothetical protein
MRYLALSEPTLSVAQTAPLAVASSQQDPILLKHPIYHHPENNLRQMNIDVMQYPGL